ncbi:MAG: serine hydrolase [Saprospiraceae bacterium]|nr:serine hydrolase [Saprospiraceae bacterium]MCB9306986.1 serine hydrolase [Lewinellaceae bacterium]
MHLQHDLDSVATTRKWPGATLALVMPDGFSISLSTGFADRQTLLPMPVDAQMLSGSTGKTFVSAIVLQLAAEGLVGIDKKVSSYFSGYDWYNRLPNAADLTVRNLLNHTSGLPRYIFQESFLNAVGKDPMQHWSPQRCLAAVLDLPAVHPAGKGWSYSDTNYILLGMLIEQVTGESYYQYLQKKLLNPLQLRHTYPSAQRRLPGLVNGYIGDRNFFNLPEETVQNGQYCMNPQFEWTGGGLVTNAADLAHWIKYLHEGKILPPKWHGELIQPVNIHDGAPARSGYGLGCFVWENKEGIWWGHAGVMPGYLTQVEYSREYRFSIAMQVNTDQGMGMEHHALIQGFSARVIRFIQKGREADEVAIRANFSSQEACWNKRDIDCYMQAYWPSDSIRTVSRDGVTRGFSNIRANYLKYFPPEKMGALHFDNMTLTRLSDNYYYVTGRFNLHYEERSESVHGWFSVLMQKINGQWWMVSDHSG